MLVAPVTAIPITAEAPVDDKVLIVLLLIFTTGDVFELVIPVTAPPAPVEIKLLIMLEEIVAGLAVLTEEPIVIPVIAPCPVILVIVFVERLDAPFQYVKFIAFTVAAPVVQLFKIFPVTVRVGAVPPSV